MQLTAESICINTKVCGDMKAEMHPLYTSVSDRLILQLHAPATVLKVK
jgi:hypothetical protein